MKKKPSRKGINSRSKGNGGENEFAKLWGEWWCGDKTAFKRTPGSGGWLGKGTDGDFVQVHGEPLCPFTHEVKRREEWDLVELILPKQDKSGERTIESWWNRTVNLGRAKRQLPFLAIRKNRRPWLVMVEASLMKQALRKVEPDVRNELRIVQGRFEIGRVALMSWEDWMGVFDPQDFLEMEGVTYGSRADSGGVGDSRAVESGSS